VGGQETLPVDVRIVSATHADLESLIAENRFREDLFYRLKVVTIHLPPLRNRREDIPLLVRHFFERIAEEQGTEPKEVSPEALQVLHAYSWPGNIRELINEVQRLSLFSGSVIGAEAVRDLERKISRSEADLDVYAGKSLEQIESEAIAAALRVAKGNKALAARILRIPRRTLYSRLKKFGL
jgi:DNA-binding NtrC family response regulator